MYPFDNMLNSPRRRKAAQVFWVAAICVACAWNYAEQKTLRDRCIITTGTVVEKVYLGTNRSGSWYPQISYFVNGEERFFVDRSSTAGVGEKVKVIYQKDHATNAYVYDFSFWINLRVIILTLLIAFVVFGLVWGLTQKFADTTEVLPSNRIL
jgi:hypothetical protein